MGVVWGNECLIFIACLLHDLPTYIAVYVSRLFFLYTSAGFSNSLKSIDCKNETKNSKLRLGENGGRVDLCTYWLGENKNS